MREITMSFSIKTKYSCFPSMPVDHRMVWRPVLVWYTICDHIILTPMSQYYEWNIIVKFNAPITRTMNWGVLMVMRRDGDNGNERLSLCVSADRKRYTPIWICVCNETYEFVCVSMCLCFAGCVTMVCFECAIRD